MTEQARRTRAAGRVIEDAMAAFDRGELPDHVIIGFRLVTTALAMKDAHQPGAIKIARDYCEAVGINADVLEEQVSARMYEAEQIDEIEKGLDDD